LVFTSIPFSGPGCKKVPPLDFISFPHPGYNFPSVLTSSFFLVFGWFRTFPFFSGQFHAFSGNHFPAFLGKAFPTSISRASFFNFTHHLKGLFFSPLPFHPPMPFPFPPCLSSMCDTPCPTRRSRAFSLEQGFPPDVPPPPLALFLTFFYLDFFCPLFAGRGTFANKMFLSLLFCFFFFWFFWGGPFIHLRLFLPVEVSVVSNLDPPSVKSFLIMVLPEIFETPVANLPPPSPRCSSGL